jgi:hypothetical protein
MRYKVSCYDTIFGYDVALGLSRYDKVVIEVIAPDEAEAIERAKKLVTRKHYKVIEVATI